MPVANEMPSPPVTKAILIRCHFVDDALLANARRLAESDDYDIIFAIDETSNIKEVEGFVTISISRHGCASLGLFVNDTAISWKCGDYILYTARDIFNEYEYFWILEYDVLLNRPDPISFFRQVDAACKQDLVISHFRPAEIGWFWRKTMEGQYAQIYRCFFPLLRISAAAVDFLREKRVEASVLASENGDNASQDWPNDEVFVSTTLYNNGFSCLDFNELGNYYDGDRFGPDILLHPRQIEVNDGFLYHPVRSGLGYLRAFPKYKASDPVFLVSQIGSDWSETEVEEALTLSVTRILTDLGDNPSRVLAENSAILEILRGNTSVEVLRSITRALAAARMPDCLERLREWLVEQGRPTLRVLENIALARPAWQSSVSQWSHIRNARLDAEGANNGLLSGDFGFHTGFETSPWWTVDLRDSYSLSEIVIYNRKTWPERLRGFEIKMSTDGRAWQTVYADPKHNQLGLIVSVNLSGQAFGRFLRIELPGQNMLHFVELQAYGARI